MRYVERNPVRAGLIGKPWEWEWSSAAFHVGEVKESRIELGDPSEIIDVKSVNWREYITDKDDPREVDEVRKCTMLGRPWGGSEFITALSKVLGISLDARKKGRPRKRK